MTEGRPSSADKTYMCIPDIPLQIEMEWQRRQRAMGLIPEIENEDATKNKVEKDSSKKEDRPRFQCEDAGFVKYYDKDQVIVTEFTPEKRPSPDERHSTSSSKTMTTEGRICDGDCFSKIDAKFDETLCKRLSERRMDRRIAVERIVKIKQRIHSEIKELIEILKERERELHMILDLDMHEISEDLDDQICVLNYYASALGAASATVPHECKCTQELKEKTCKLFDNNEDFNSALKFEYSSNELEDIKRALYNFGMVKKTQVKHKDIAQYRENSGIISCMANLLASKPTKNRAMGTAPPLKMKIPLHHDYYDDSDSSISSDDFEVVDHYDAENAIGKNNYNNAEACSATKALTEVVQDALKDASLLSKEENAKDNGVVNSKAEGNASKVENIKSKICNCAGKIFSPKRGAAETAKRVNNLKGATTRSFKTPLPLKQQCALKCPAVTNMYAPTALDYFYPRFQYMSNHLANLESGFPSVVSEKTKPDASSALTSACETFFDKDYQKWLYNHSESLKPGVSEHPLIQATTTAINKKMAEEKNQKESAATSLLRKKQIIASQTSDPFAITTSNYLRARRKPANGEKPIALDNSSLGEVSETESEKATQMSKTMPPSKENAEFLSRIRPDKSVLKKIIKDIGKKMDFFDVTGEFGPEGASETNSPRRVAAMKSQLPDQPHKRGLTVTEALRHELKKQAHTERAPLIDNSLDAAYGTRGFSPYTPPPFGYVYSGPAGFPAPSMRFNNPNGETPQPVFFYYPFSNGTNPLPPRPPTLITPEVPGMRSPPVLKPPRQYFVYDRPPYLQPTYASSFKGSNPKSAGMMDPEPPVIPDFGRTAKPASLYSARPGEWNPPQGPAKQGMKPDLPPFENLKHRYYDAFTPPIPGRTASGNVEYVKWEDVCTILPTTAAKKFAGATAGVEGSSEVKMAGKPPSVASNFDYFSDITGGDKFS